MNKNILFVEDGSVDVDELKKTLPEFPVIVYRQGSRPPMIVEILPDSPFSNIDLNEFKSKPKIIERDSPATMERVWQAIKRVFDEKCHKELNPFNYQETNIFYGNFSDFIDEIRKCLGESK